jgi:hypothetical protein
MAECGGVTAADAKQIILVVGVPCAGKSWVCEQLDGLYSYVRHDDHIGGDYVAAIRGRTLLTTKPVLAETPFSMSQIVEPLQARGLEVKPVFIIEHPDELRARYLAREGKPIPAGHLSRQKTYEQRSKDTGAFRGNSAAVLEYLKRRAPPEKWPWQS